MSKILILANSSGGLYDFRNELLLRLLKEGNEVLTSLPDTVRTAEIAAEGCRVIHTPINRRGMNPSQDYHLLKEYKRLLKTEKPDLVITYTIKPNIYGGFLCRKLKIPYITTITGLGSTFEREGLMKKLIVRMYRAGLRGCECIFFQNAENREIFRNLGITGKKDRLVGGSGVDLTRHPAEPYPGHQDDVTRFVYVGRLMREKGTQEYLTAAQALHDRYDDRVSVAAIGYCDDDYQSQLEEAQKKGILKAIPFQKDIHPYLREADAVVMPSWHEGMSNVIMEASATGRPVLASDISGCRELVEDGTTGFLFEARNAQSLIAAMNRFMETPLQERAAMGQMARKKMEREFDRQCIIDAYMDTIDTVLSRRQDKVQ
ncbi:MAG: glycosyltransferase family 4 protein [Butyrivibrio sp.]|jgi:galacturonosyltransferase|nr:glycosyltransferase family 4 protein [Butyrivibrio sp.]